MSVRKSFATSPYFTTKHSGYFDIYEELFAKYRNSDITFVEVGVFHGGSLFMWREYFGPNARIIGIDLNPIAKKWEEFGFEIHVGDQSSVDFWSDFFAEVGNVDIILDDGGHTNRQQLITAACALRAVNDGGLLVIEDTHTSYMPAYANPSKHSVISWLETVFEHMHTRNANLESSENQINKSVWRVSVFESIIALHVNRDLCRDTNVVDNSGAIDSAEDFHFIQESFAIRMLTGLADKLHSRQLLNSNQQRAISSRFGRASTGHHIWSLGSKIAACCLRLLRVVHHRETKNDVNRLISQRIQD